MKGLTQTKVLHISEQAALVNVGDHYHGKHTNLFVKSVVANTVSKEVVTNVALDAGAIVQTKETITYVASLTITTDRAVIDILLPTDTDIAD